MLHKSHERSVILGCGDVGRRIAKYLIETGVSPNDLKGFVNSAPSLERARLLDIECELIDLDDVVSNLNDCDGAQVYYTVAPQKQGLGDERTRRISSEFTANHIRPAKVVLISTTGVYGDCNGEWVSELSPTVPKTPRGQQRLDSENQWLTWGETQQVDVVVLRVPGIYAFSRLPRERLQRKTPVVRASECGFTNRIHADDLARVCVLAMRNGSAGEVYNVTDGSPGTISEYLQAAARALNYDPLPEISMSQARAELSVGMLSYLSESRKISNQKMLEKLGVELLYPDFREGLVK